MVKGRRRNFDLAAFGGQTIFGEHGGEQLELLRTESFFVVFGESPSLPRELGDDGIFGEIFFVHPGKLREYLQIAPVLQNELRDTGFRASRKYLRTQFLKPGPAVQEVVVELEGA